MGESGGGQKPPLPRLVRSQTTLFHHRFYPPLSPLFQPPPFTVNFFRKLFGSQKTPSAKAPSPAPASVPAPAQPEPEAGPAAEAPAPAAAPEGQNLIRVHDAYGREVFLTKDQWREAVLKDHLEKVRDKPDELAAVIAQSLRDGMAADVLRAAARLSSIDTNRERGHLLHAATLLELKRHAEAEGILDEFVAKHGETGPVLSALARIYADRGDQPAAKAALDRALALDPNHDAGLALHLAAQREQGGAEAEFDALRRVAEQPDAWRARLALARHHLSRRELPAAIKLYDEALAAAPRPVPVDLLQQMSADLGNHAHLPELLQLTAPYYDIAQHGLVVGSNLLKAYHDLGQLDPARRLLDRLYAQQRPDWRQTLSAWEQELAKTRASIADPAPSAKLEVALLAMPGPVWLPPESPANELFPAKPDTAPLISFLGGSAEITPPSPGAGDAGARLADAAARLARALPLYLAEQAELRTGAFAQTLVAWVTKPRPGFILGGQPWDDATASRHARRDDGDGPADYLVVTHLRCQAEPWTIELRLLRTIDAARLATVEIPCSPENPGLALPAVARALFEQLAAHADLPAAASAEPAGPPPERLTHYFVRLEQLLGVRAAGLPGGAATLQGERDILDGMLRLCLELPESLPARLILAHGVRAMRHVRPEIPGEFRARLELLQKEKPLPEPAQSVVARILAEGLGS